MYSQNAEDKIIQDYFGDIKGTFLDVGANDGKTLSNTRALADSGWCGVLIEPSPKAFYKLKQLYDGDKTGCFYLYNFAISDHNGTLKFYDSGTHLNKGDVGLLSTSNEEELKRFPGTQYEEIEVKCFRWKTALNRFKFKLFDFVSIDAEGADLEILSQIDLSTVKCLCIEWNSKPEVKAEYDKIMTDFKVIYTSAENIIYAR